jgi:hypothetical protein
MGENWHAWHSAYDDPHSNMSRRLVLVQDRIRAWLDSAPPGRLTVLSMCAGQGRDLLGVLPTHPRRHDVTAHLVELDPGLAATAARAADGLNVRVIVGDAALTDQYAGLVPADLVLVCGVFGNLSDADVEATIDAGTQLCATGGTVVWTRNRRAPDLVPQICAWYEERGFERVWLSPPGTTIGVGVHRFTGQPAPLATGVRLFTFQR